jgi:hypothetical protein
MLRADLEVEAHERAFGTGWISGVLALACALFGLGAVLFMMLPGVFTMPMLREQYSQPWFRLALHFILIGAFVLAVLNIILRKQKIMGLAAITAVLIATLLGGSHVEQQHARHGTISASTGSSSTCRCSAFSSSRSAPVRLRTEQSIFRLIGARTCSISSSTACSCGRSPSCR